MASVVVDDTKLTAIADSIRAKTENPAAMTLDQMASTVTNSLSATPMVTTIEAVSEIEDVSFALTLYNPTLGIFEYAASSDGIVMLVNPLPLLHALSGMHITEMFGLNGFSSASLAMKTFQTEYDPHTYALKITFKEREDF